MMKVINPADEKLICPLVAFKSCHFFTSPNRCPNMAKYVEAVKNEIFNFRSTLLLMLLIAHTTN